MVGNYCRGMLATMRCKGSAGISFNLSSRASLTQVHNGPKEKNTARQERALFINVSEHHARVSGLRPRRLEMYMNCSLDAKPLTRDWWVMGTVFVVLWGSPYQLRLQWVRRWRNLTHSHKKHVNVVGVSGQTTYIKIWQTYWFRKEHVWTCVVKRVALLFISQPVTTSQYIEWLWEDFTNDGGEGRE